MEGVAPKAFGVGRERVAAEFGPGHALAQRPELRRGLGDAAAPEEIGVSIMAEIISVRRGGRGLPMSEIARDRELRLSR